MVMDSSGGCSRCSSVYRVRVVCSVEGIRLRGRRGGGGLVFNEEIIRCF